MKKIKVNVGLYGGALLGALLILGLCGYIVNIFKLIWLLDGDVTAMLIARCIGAVFPPFGGLLGFF